MESPKRLVLFSYFPFLTEKVVELGLKHSQELTPELIELLTGAIGEGQQFASASACIWLIVNDRPAPMLVLRQAKRIYDDLIIWAEDKPEEWFSVELLEKHDAYALALFPKVEKSIVRHGFAHLIQEEQILLNPRYDLIFAPLHFVSKPGRHSYSKIKDQVGDTVPVYLCDVEHLDPTRLEELDESLIHSIGTLKVSRPRSPAIGYLDELIESARKDWIRGAGSDLELLLASPSLAQEFLAACKKLS